MIPPNPKLSLGLEPRCNALRARRDRSCLFREKLCWGYNTMPRSRRAVPRAAICYLSRCLSDSSPVPVKSNMQKAEVKWPKQSREHEVHRRKLMPHSCISLDLSASKGLKRKSRRSRLEKNHSAWRSIFFCRFWSQLLLACPHFLHWKGQIGPCLPFLCC